MSALPPPVRVMRIVARLNVGGPAIHVTFLAKYMDRDEFESMLVTGTENPGEGSMVEFAREHGVEPVVVPEMMGQASLGPRDLVAVWKVYRLMCRYRPDIVDTHTAKAGFVGRIAGWIAGVPVIVHTYHGHVLYGYYSPLTNWLLARMEWLLGHLSSRLIAVSEQVKHDLVQHGVAPAEKIAVVPLGIELQPFFEAVSRRGVFKQELGLAPETRLVGIVGRIFPIKNHALFVEAAARVASRTPDARFIVVGDGVLRSEVEEQARALGLGARIVFTGWRRDLPEICADLDLLVVSSDNEGTPIAAIEAMAASVPVVATRVGGIPDLLRDGETGILVPPRDPEALAAAIVALLGDPDRRRRIGTAARQDAASRFDVSRMVEETAVLYREALSRDEVRYPS